MDYILKKIIMKKEIIDIFKVPVSSTLLNLKNKKELEQTIFKMKNSKGRFVSNLSGYQSYDIENEAVFTPLLSHIKKIGVAFAKELGLTDKLRINNFWININRFKDANTLHNHPDCILSGTFYVRVPKNSGPIVFRHPAAPVVSLYFDKYVQNFKAYNSSFWKIYPTDNQLLIFPSWLEHSVEPNMNPTEERITIAFNLTPK